MKALVPRNETVELADVDEPRLAAHEALIRVEAFSVNRGETFQLETDRPGWRPGKDVAGLVVQGAADGTGPAPGTRVVGHPPAAGWAEYAAVSTDALAELPSSVTTVQAAALPLAGLTTLRLLRTAGAITGRRILLTGASGGVGHYVVELAVAAGASITAVSSTADRGARLAALGADVVSDVAAAAGPYDLVLESTGGATLPLALAKLRRRGTLIWFGQASRCNSTSSGSSPGPSPPCCATSTTPTSTPRTHPTSRSWSGWSPPAGCTPRSGVRPTGPTPPPSSPTCATAASAATPC
jgi:NADPH2:quinone reductase